VVSPLASAWVMRRCRDLLVTQVETAGLPMDPTRAHAREPLVMDQVGDEPEADFSHFRSYLHLLARTHLGRPRMVSFAMCSQAMQRGCP
jgi:hypothetical protein